MRRSPRRHPVLPEGCCTLSCALPTNNVQLPPLRAVDLGARAPDLTEIPPLNIPRAGICFVDCKLGGRTDSSAQACCAGAAVADDEQVVWLCTELEELAGYQRTVCVKSRGGYRPNMLRTYRLDADRRPVQ
jgi:hypothetical protein